MKVYVGGASGEVCGACVARSIKEAKALLWGRLRCMRCLRRGLLQPARPPDRDLDAKALPVGVVRDSAMLRAMGFWVEGDPACISCGLYTMGDEFPLCPDCEQCEECGHAEDCGHDPR